MSDTLRKLSPTRSPALAIIVLVGGTVAAFALASAISEAQHLPDHQSLALHRISGSFAILVAAVLYGLGRRFRTSTTRTAVSAPRAAVVVFWIALWIGRTEWQAGLDGWPEWLRDLPFMWTGLAVLALAVVLFIALPSPSIEERTCRTRAPAWYRIMPWTALFLASLSLEASRAAWWTPRGWQVVYVLAIVVFFLGYALDARWYRNQRRLRQDEARAATEKEEAPATE